MKNFVSCVYTDYFKEASLPELFEMLHKTGFGACDLSRLHGALAMDYAESLGGPDRYEKAGAYLKELAAENKIEFNQGHIEYLYDILSPGVLEYLKNQTALYASAGIKAIVFHVSGDSPKDPEGFNREEALIRAVNSLSEAVVGTDALLCIENLRSSRYVCTSDRILAFRNKLNHPERFGICLDTGHLNLNKSMNYPLESQSHFVENAGALLKAIHLNGNNGSGDDHLLPFNGREELSPDWKDFMKALVQSPYEGALNFEIPGEAGCPLEVRIQKTAHIHWVKEYLQSDSFLNA